jgi:hypothetical protein
MLQVTIVQKNLGVHQTDCKVLARAYGLYRGIICNYVSFCWNSLLSSQFVLCNSGPGTTELAE